MATTGKKTKLVGITGTISSGKSLVGSYLASKGIPVIDSDQVVHDLLESNPAVVNAIAERFGKEVIASAGGRRSVDRKALGRVVFEDQAARRDLEKIVHPATIMAIRRRIAEHDKSPVVAVLVPLLFEAGLENEYDEIWTVYTSQASLVERLMRRDGLSREAVRARLAAQLPQEEKTRRADHVIDNSGDREETFKQIDRLIS